MKKIVLLTVLLMAVYSCLTAGTIRKEYPLSMGKTVEVDLQAGGSIQMQGWDREVVEVHLQLSSGVSLDDVMEVKSDADGIRIECFAEESGHGQFNISLNVPAESDVEVNTMGGDIKLAKIKGALSGKTMGGDLRFSELEGTIKMTTMGGSIDIVNSVLDGKVNTMGGNITLNNVTGDLDGHSMGGNVIYRNVYNKDGSPRVEGKEVKITTMGGNIELADAPAGADVHTMGGNIEIEKAGKYVKAKTMGGQIKIDALDGWVKASTMGGDVMVTMTGDPSKGKRDVDLSSMGGTIELTLPKDISCVFDISQTITKNKNGKYKIKSDFDLNIDDSAEWEYSKGSPRKEIKATGKAGNGEHRISIETINGDIIIHKGS